MEKLIKPGKNFSVILALLAIAFGAAVAAQSRPPRIDVARAPAPLFDDPEWHGATDPFVIWNPSRHQWFMYYTQRRATMPTPNGVDWVHGAKIGIATSPDGIHWSYLGTAKGDHDLSDPLSAKGLGPEPGVTWWAPCFLYQGKTLHMFVTLVDGVYPNWTGKRHILHFTSADGVMWKYINTCALNSERVIDPMVYRIKDTWYMVYKDEGAGSHTYRSESRNLINWTNHQQTEPDGRQEAPFVFRWQGEYWMIVDSVPDKGLRIYKSPNGINQWEYNSTVLAAADGTRPSDNNVGHHPGIVMQSSTDGTEQCLLFYFTHQNRQTVMQLAELELGADGKAFCRRNKYSQEPEAATNMRSVQAPVTKPEAADKPSPRTDRNSMVAHSELVEKTRKGRIDIYFLGDSITRRWGTIDPQYKDFLENWRQNFFGWNAANFGWGGDTTQNMLWRLANGELDNVNPKIIVLLAGTNNVGKKSPEGASDQRVEDVTRGIKAILDLCRTKAPRASIVLMGITPRNDNMAVMPIIDRINAQLAKFADGKKIRYLNINNKLADRDGRLFEGMANKDGLHLDVKGYQVWADALKPIFKQLLGPPAREDHAPPATGDPSVANRPTP